MGKRRRMCIGIYNECIYIINQCARFYLYWRDIRLRRIGNIRISMGNELNYTNKNRKCYKATNCYSSHFHYLGFRIVFEIFMH